MNIILDKDQEKWAHVANKYTIAHSCVLDAMGYFGV